MLSIIADSRFLFLLRGAAQRVLSLVATDCPLCEGAAAGGELCAGCYGDITFTMRNGDRRCARCAQRKGAGQHACLSCVALDPVFTRAIAAFDYEPPFDSLIGRYKSEHRFGLSTTLAKLLVDAIGREGGTERAVPRVGPTDAGSSRVGKTWAVRGDSDLCNAGLIRHGGTYALKAGTILVPIPSSNASLRHRGFNPAAELAASLGAYLQLPVRRGVLRRLREGPRQAFSSRLARRQGAQGLFDCTVPIDGLPVGLVDDVMTTGSTVNAAARALLRAGASEVTVLVAARAPMRQRYS